jgi:general secretion pathway protein C
VSITAGNDQLLSARLARLGAERAAQLVVLALIIALGLDSALILTRALGAASAPQATTVPANNLPFGSGNHNPQLLLATVVNAHLFGAAPTAVNANAPPTTLPLILTGVIADPGHPGRGQAIIGSSAAAATLYSVGSAVSGGAHLHAVYADRVLLERNGALETLMLPRTPLAGASYTPAPRAPVTGGLLQSNSASLLAGLLRVQPVFSQGKLSGYRVFPAGAQGPQAFRQLGLRPGDLILAINGTNLDDPSRAVEILQTLSSSGSAQVTVSRNGTPTEVNLDLATLSNEAQQYTQGTPGAGTPAVGMPPPGPIGAPMRRRSFGMPASDLVDPAGSFGLTGAAE